MIEIERILVKMVEQIKSQIDDIDIEKLQSLAGAIEKTLENWEQGGEESDWEGTTTLDKLETIKENIEAVVASVEALDQALQEE